MKKYLLLFLMLGMVTLAGAQTSVPGWNVTGAAGAGGGTTCGTPTCTVSSAGSGNGVLALSGNTSGTATFTAPAIAGTTTNAVTMSNTLLGPSGAAATTTYAVASANSGLYSAGVSQPAISSASIPIMSWSNGSPANVTLMPRNTTIGFGTNLSSNVDIGFSSLAANVMQLGNGTLNDESGLLRVGNACRVTGDITLPVNTATNVCSWSLPASAKGWAWQCKIIWAITAGSGTNTISVGVNPSQTPTGTTNVAATIYSSTALAGSQAAVALSASGPTNVLTSGTITPGATLEQAEASGTLLASGTAGTFAVTMTAAGTTATAAAKAGSTCSIY